MRASILLAASSLLAPALAAPIAPSSDTPARGSSPSFLTALLDAYAKRSDAERRFITGADASIIAGLHGVGVDVAVGRRTDTSTVTDLTDDLVKQIDDLISSTNTKSKRVDTSTVTGLVDDVVEVVEGLDVVRRADTSTVTDLVDDVVATIDDTVNSVSGTTEETTEETEETTESAAEETEETTESTTESSSAAKAKRFGGSQEGGDGEGSESGSGSEGEDDGDELISVDLDVSVL